MSTSIWRCAEYGLEQDGIVAMNVGAITNWLAEVSAHFRAVQDQRAPVGLLTASPRPVSPASAETMCGCASFLCAKHAGRDLFARFHPTLAGLLFHERLDGKPEYDGPPTRDGLCRPAKQGRPAKWIVFLQHQTGAVSALKPLGTAESLHCVIALGAAGQAWNAEKVACLTDWSGGLASFELRASPLKRAVAVLSKLRELGVSNYRNIAPIGAGSWRLTYRSGKDKATRRITCLGRDITLYFEIDNFIFRDCRTIQYGGSTFSSSYGLPMMLRRSVERAV